MFAQQKSPPERSAVLCKAVFNARAELGLTNEGLGKIIGLERSSVSRTKKAGEIEPDSKAGELGLMLVRIYRSLFALLGESPESIKHWMKTENKHLNGVPAVLVEKAEGLTRVTAYLDSMRGNA